MQLIRELGDGEGVVSAPCDGSREGIGRCDRDPFWANAAQGLDELLQPRALIESQRCPEINIPGHRPQEGLVTHARSETHSTLSALHCQVSNVRNASATCGVGTNETVGALQL